MWMYVGLIVSTVFFFVGVAFLCTVPEGEYEGLLEKEESVNSRRLYKNIGRAFVVLGLFSFIGFGIESGLDYWG
jgi:hypothetical protein